VLLEYQIPEKVAKIAIVCSSFLLSTRIYKHTVIGHRTPWIGTDNNQEQTQKEDSKVHEKNLVDNVINTDNTSTSNVIRYYNITVLYSNKRDVTCDMMECLSSTATQYEKSGVK